MSIIFFDIDGTLAEGTKVPQSAADAVARTRKRGNLVFICSGRPLRYATAHFGAYADGFVCSNGRLAVHGEQVIIDQALNPNQIAHIVRILDKHDAGYAFCAKDQQYYGGNPAYRATAEEANGPAVSLAEALDKGISLYSFDIFFGTPAERDAIARDLDDVCLVNPHGPHPSADVTVLGYGKGDAVCDITAKLGMNHSESYAFGDGINDLSMVRMAGHGVAMGNAVAELKAAAEFVTTAIGNDGVANGLVHYGLA